VAKRVVAATGAAIFALLAHCAQIADPDVAHCQIWTIELDPVSDGPPRPKFNEKKQGPPGRIKSLQERLDRSWDAYTIGLRRLVLRSEHAKESTMIDTGHLGAAPGDTKKDFDAAPIRTHALRPATKALREAQGDLAHVDRIATIGGLSVTHEVTQPISAIVNNAQAARNFLNRRPPDLDEVRQALDCIVRDAYRASDVVYRIRGLLKEAPPKTERAEINKAIRDVLELTHDELTRSGVSVRTQFAEPSPVVQADRVGLQQVILNLIINAVEAMSSMREGARELQICTEKVGSNAALVAVRDSGPGLDLKIVDHLFEAFYTTKVQGMGIGLAICRSIIEAHGGRMWAGANEPRGAVFQFTVPLERDEIVPAGHTDR
jgi:C4-dicarboxylate-specific signal transduction histidine kinase